MDNTTNRIVGYIGIELYCFYVFLLLLSCIAFVFLLLLCFLCFSLLLYYLFIDVRLSHLNKDYFLTEPNEKALRWAFIKRTPVSYVFMVME